MARVAGRKDGGGSGGRSPSGRSTEVLGTDLGPQWPEGREQGGPAERHRERFGLIYPESDRKLAGFQAGMWLSVILILTPWYQRGDGKARDLGWKAVLEPSVLPDRALAKSPAPKGWTVAWARAVARLYPPGH